MMGDEIGVAFAGGVQVGVVDVDVGEPGEGEVDGGLEGLRFLADLLDVEDELDGRVIHGTGDRDPLLRIVHEVG